jgi:N-acetylglucosaminyldiphosphoundecaprenol N-acetyl-beta-D-mannosaminyltransferase
MYYMAHVEIDGQPITNASLPEAVEIITGLAMQDQPSLVVTANLQHLRTLRSDTEFHDAYAVAEHRFPDGMPLVWMSRIIGNQLVERTTGTDIEEGLCEYLGQNGLGGHVLYIGGSQAVNEQAVANRRNQFPDLQIEGYAPPQGYDRDSQESRKLVEFINTSSESTPPDSPLAIFLCTGAPKSEKWAAKHLGHLQRGVIVPAGAAIDFIAGSKPRAGSSAQRLGLEWLYRLCHEPQRLSGRYARDALYMQQLVWRSFKQRW